MSSLTLYCLPHSGASAMVYSRWSRKLPNWIDVKPVELPGRGMRLGQPLQSNMISLVDMLAKEIAQQSTVSKPYAIFGHSLGAMVAFELAHALPKYGLRSPVMLLASGTAAPTRREDYEDRLSEPKTDEELMEDLRSLQGTPEEILANRELMELTLPVMRSDYLLCGRYEYRHADSLRLNCPVHVLAGEDDRATEEQLLAWHQETSSTGELTYFKGGHFFTQECENEVLALIGESLSKVLPKQRMVGAF